MATLPTEADTMELFELAFMLLTTGSFCRTTVTFWGNTEPTSSSSPAHQWRAWSTCSSMCTKAMIMPTWSWPCTNQTPMIHKTKDPSYSMMRSTPTWIAGTSLHQKLYGGCQSTSCMISLTPSTDWLFTCLINRGSTSGKKKQQLREQREVTRTWLHGSGWTGRTPMRATYSTVTSRNTVFIDWEKNLGNQMQRWKPNHQPNVFGQPQRSREVLPTSSPVTCPRRHQLWWPEDSQWCSHCQFQGSLHSTAPLLRWYRVL